MNFQALRTAQGDTLKTGSGAPVFEGLPASSPPPPPPPFVPMLPSPRGLRSQKGVPLRTTGGMFVLGGALPLPAVKLIIAGVTKDSNGNALGGCAVALYRMADNVCVETVTSNGSGAYVFSTAGGAQGYYARAVDPTGLLVGTTLNTLVGVA